MEKIVEQGILYDFYGPLLTEHQRKIYELAVYENLSLMEIAESEGISKQAVHDLLRRATSQMRTYEERLGMIGRFRKIRSAAETLREAARQPDSGDLPAVAAEIADRILNDLG